MCCHSVPRPTGFELPGAARDNHRMSSVETEAPSAPILRSERDAVATLELNEPQRFNPLSEATLDALAGALDELADDPRVRLVVLAARGRAFCAGHDLREMRSQPSKAYYQALFNRCSDVMLRIVRLPKPVIARVQGLATAAGCQLVASADLAVAARSATFAVSGITLGLFCSTPSVALSRNVSRKKAFEMLMTGGFIDAEEAARAGLVNRVADDDALDAAVAELSEQILRHPQVAVETGKRMFYRQLENNLEDAYAYAAETMACNMMEQDTLEGVQAFLDKRPPAGSG